MTTQFNDIRKNLSKISKFIVWLCSYCDQEGRIIDESLSPVGSIVVLSHKVLELVTRDHNTGFIFFFGVVNGVVYIGLW